MQTGNAIQKGGEVMDITIITGSTPEELMGLLGEKDATAWRIEGGVSVCVDSTGKQTYAILLVAQDGNTPPGKQK
jgi:hypothetical protein